MQKTIIANWKGLPETIEHAEELFAQTRAHLSTLSSEGVDVVVCPQFSYLERIAGLLRGDSSMALGVQDFQEPGSRLSEVGVRFVIVGHSDRRWKAGDSDEVTNAKLKGALRAGLTPIVCLGERTRDEGWQEALAAQTIATLDGLTEGQVAQCIIAYEPVWAISTNPDALPDTPASAVQSMNLIREIIADHHNVSHASFLYGGSVVPANVVSFLERPQVRGVLVGGASVRIDDFRSILTSASELA